jgi:very-short-patch-repair endonuclease
MEVVDALRAMGGTARWKELRGHVSWRAIKQARADHIVGFGGGAYFLEEAPAARIAAAKLSGVRSHTTAAAHWGLALPPEASEIHLTVRRNAHRDDVGVDVTLHYRDLASAEIDAGLKDITTSLRTVVDCLRDCSLRVALSVGDSALRTGLVQIKVLTAAVGTLKGPGSRVARTRLALLDARAANAFESSARALLLEGGITSFVPQVEIEHAGVFVGRVDLADLRRRVVVECDGFETHGGRGAFVRDLVRFTMLVSAGWRPLRFTWEQVMFQPEWVLARVRDVVRGAVEEDERPSRPDRPAA